MEDTMFCKLDISSLISSYSEDIIYNITEGKWFIKDYKVLVCLPETILEPVLIVFAKLLNW